MASLLELSRCLELTRPGPKTLRRDLLGIPRLRGTGPIALREHLLCLSQKNHFNLNVIFAGTLAQTNRPFVERAVQVCRAIWMGGRITLGRVTYTFHPTAPTAAGGPVGEFANINCESDVHAMTRTFSVRNDGIDCFLVDNLTCGLGFAPPGGPPFKTSASKDGIAVELNFNRNALQVGRTMAHEVGHYFGLGHWGLFKGVSVMDPSDNTPTGGSWRISTDQRNYAHHHGFVNGACE